MKKLLIVYHSQSGNTEQLARALFRAVSSHPDYSVRFLQAAAATLDDLLWCDLVIFGAAEYLGTLSGMMKDFFDRTFHDAKSQHLHKPYGIFISAGNDGRRAAAEIERIVRHYPFYPLAEPCIVNGKIAAQDLSAVEEYGHQLLALYARRS